MLDLVFLVDELTEALGPVLANLATCRRKTQPAPPKSSDRAANASD
jgi:hypothetical protein